jgi:hypothetical protein
MGGEFGCWKHSISIINVSITTFAYSGKSEADKQQAFSEEL